MVNMRKMSWSAAMRDLRNERARRAGVREERLRATAGLRGALRLSSWRGRSGRRYVVGIHSLSDPDLSEVTRAVLIAVRRDREGIARVIDVAAAGDESRERTHRAWIARARSQGATEMHVHRLAENAPERHAIIVDLTDEDDEAAA